MVNSLIPIKAKLGSKKHRSVVITKQTKTMYRKAYLGKV